MKRYIVKWHEKVRGIDSKYMCFKVEFVRKKEAEGMFNWLLYCKRKDPIRNVFIYDNESKKTIRRNNYGITERNTNRRASHNNSAM